LGGGGGAWVDVLNVTTAYGVTWYCSDNVKEDDGTLCFEESDTHCADRALGETCKTTALTDDDKCLPVDTDADADADADTDTDSDSDADSDKQLAGSQRTTFMKVFPLYCGVSSHPQRPPRFPLVAALALALRRRSR
jgi:hypothetical protein